MATTHVDQSKPIGLHEMPVKLLEDGNQCMHQHFSAKAWDVFWFVVFVCALNWPSVLACLCHMVNIFCGGFNPFQFGSRQYVARRLMWSDHAIGMWYAANLPPERWISRVLAWNPLGRRRSGCPRTSWPNKFISYTRYRHLGNWQVLARDPDLWRGLMDDFCMFCGRERNAIVVCITL